MERHAEAFSTVSISLSGLSFSLFDFEAGGVEEEEGEIMEGGWVDIESTLLSCFDMKV